MLQAPTPQASESPETGLRPPSPPPANRLNKMALVAVAVIMGATLLAMALLGGDEDQNGAADSATQAQAETGQPGPISPSFLDRPPQGPTGDVVLDPFTGLPTSDGATPAQAPDGALVPPVYATETNTAADPALGGGASGASDPYGQASTQTHAAYHNPYASAYDQVSAADAKSPQEEALERALTSALSPQRSGGNQNGGEVIESGSAYDQGTGGEVELYREAQRMISSLSQAYGPGTGPAITAVQDAPDRADEQVTAGEDHYRQFLQAAATSRQDGANYIATTVHHPISPYELREGTMLEAYLVTGVNSELPGEVVAQVSRNVYDSQTQQTLLIPKGSRLIGTYDNQVALDQSRLLVAWTRLVFPDGRSVNLPGLNTKDVRGANGLTGDVNRHLSRAFGRALMLSVVGAGFQLSQPRPRAGYNAYPTPGEIAAGAVGTELSRVATELLRRDLNVRPTIRIRGGTPFNVFLNGDLVLAPYQGEDGFLPTRQGAGWINVRPQSRVESTPLN